MALYGKVIKIFDENSLLVNLGEKDGLKRGDRLVVIEKGGEVKDPDSNESLGEIELIKAELTAADVQEKLTILRTEPGRDSSRNLPLSARMVQDSVKADFAQCRMSVAPGEMSGIPTPTPVKAGDLVRHIG
ncbi:MAG: hypothetical protein KAX38_06195 [Candidatus Krumholzibacteria bacterium]|nr:hypothetical protein [Candidatus Krumholzibacteria bacterium]